MRENPAIRPALAEHIRLYGLRTDGQFTLRSGEVTSWYLDARQTTFDGEGAGLVGRCVAELLAPEVVAVGGMTMGADPMAVATALVASEAGRPLRAFSIRKQAKDHGMGGRLVGPVRPGDRVAILEDTTTTGGALDEAIEVAVDFGLSVVQAIALVDRSGGRVTAALAARGIPYRGIFFPEDLGVP
ncbi:MAG: orotate phosphoribosyltransferase [Acidimicrobiia bacterium]